MRGLYDSVIEEKILQEIDISFTESVNKAVTPKASQLGNTEMSKLAFSQINRIASRNASASSGHSYDRSSLHNNN